jgi:hypothetical protein
MFHSLGNIFFLLFFFIVLFGIIFGREIYLLVRKQTILRLIKEAANSCAKKHLKTLGRKKKNLVFQDEYGKENRNGWDKELEYFWRSVLREEIANILEQHGADKAMKRSFGGDKGIKQAAIEEVNRLVTFAAAQTRDQDTDSAPTNPYEYEGYCRRLLEQVGWKAQQIGRSGD